MHRFRFYGIDTLGITKKWKNKYYSIEHGTNSRLDEIQSSILNLKLKNINFFIKRRRLIAKKYFNGLKNLNIELPIVNKNNFHVFHVFEVAHKNRNKIIKKMKKRNINLSIHYPYPIHKMRGYKNFIKKNNNRLYETEKKSKMIFSLPIYPSLRDTEIQTIIHNLKEIISKF